MTDDDEGVLSPDELELPDDHVTELDDERLVIHPNAAPDDEGRRPSKPGESTDDHAVGTAAADAADSRTGEPDDGERADGLPAADWALSDSVDVPEAYALAAAAKTEHGVDQRLVRSNDVGRTFESFLRWYADRIAPDRDPEEVLRVLVAASELDARVETRR